MIDSFLWELFSQKNVLTPLSKKQFLKIWVVKIQTYFQKKLKILTPTEKSICKVTIKVWLSFNEKVTDLQIDNDNNFHLLLNKLLVFSSTVLSYPRSWSSNNKISFSNNFLKLFSGFDIISTCNKYMQKITKTNTSNYCGNEADFMEKIS